MFIQRRLEGSDPKHASFPGASDEADPGSQSGQVSREAAAADPGKASAGMSLGTLGSSQWIC